MKKKKSKVDEEGSVWGKERPAQSGSIRSLPTWSIKDKPTIDNVHPSEIEKICEHCGEDNEDCDCYCGDCGELREDCNYCSECDSHYCIMCEYCEMHGEGECVCTEEEIRGRELAETARRMKEQQERAQIEATQQVF